MRLVLDPNVFVSTALKQSSWPGAVNRWIDTFGGRFKSSAIEAQVIAVLQRPYFVSKLPLFYLETVRRVLANAELVTIVECITACRDPTDDKFLELAVNGHADVIVSGDLDLLVLSPLPRHSHCRTSHFRSGRGALSRLPAEAIRRVRR